MKPYEEDLEEEYAHHRMILSGCIGIFLLASVWTAVLIVAVLSFLGLRG